MSIYMITISRSEYEGMKPEFSEHRLLIQQLRDEFFLLKSGNNCRTSSTAPSHDIGRCNSFGLPVSSVRKAGGQAGLQSSTLLMSDTPNEIIHHPFVCGQCSEDLQIVESNGFTPRQEVNLPPTSPIYFEHPSHVKICPFFQSANKGIFSKSLNQ